MSSNYPAGAEHDPSAPYNWEEYPEREFNVTVEVVVSKSHSLTGSYYVEEDEEGSCIVCNEEDWRRRYEEQCHSIPHLLDELKRYAEAELRETKDSSRRAELKGIIADCEGWEVEEVTINEQ